MQFHDQLEDLKRSDDPRKTHNIQVGDRVIPVRLKKANVSTKTLIITFHGAVDRSTREVPSFVGYSPALDGAHQLAISDPSMLVDGEFSLSWYAGDKGFATQDVLKSFFQAVCEALGIERTIYFGTSGGGFAALYYSWHHPDSIVVAGNPQTKISNYYGGHIDRYLSACWPDQTDLSTCICEDVGTLYAKSTPNFVIYIQAATDAFHLNKHMVSFLADIGYRKNRPLLVNVDYFGKLGHSPTFDAYVPWLQAAMMVSDVTIEEVVKTRHALLAAKTAPAALQTAAQKKNTSARPVDDQKIQTADMIRDWQLGDTASWPQTPTKPSSPKPSGVPPSPKDTTLISKIFGRR